MDACVFEGVILSVVCVVDDCWCIFVKIILWQGGRVLLTIMELPVSAKKHCRQCCEVVVRARNKPANSGGEY